MEARSEFLKLLGNEVRGALLDSPLDVDPSAAGPPQVAAAASALVRESQSQAQSELLTQLQAGLGEAAGGDRVRAVLGLDDVRQALTEGRVGTLLLAAQFSGPEREETIRAAIELDADIVAFSDEVSELGPARPVAALLRF